MTEPMIHARFAAGRDGYGSHYHDSHQLIYVKKGQIRLQIGRNTYEAGPGTLALISRLEPHSIEILSEDYERFTVTVSPEVQNYTAYMGETLVSALVNRPDTFQHAVCLTDTEETEKLLQLLVGESDSTEILVGKMRVFLLSQLLVLFCRAYPKSIPEKPENLQRIQQIRLYLEENFAYKCDLASLADRFHLSQSYLSHQFREVTGSSVIAYLTAFRIAEAKRRLVDTDCPVVQVATECGFTDHSNFGRTFRSMTGMSPKEFRKKYRSM